MFGISNLLLKYQFSRRQEKSCPGLNKKRILFVTYDAIGDMLLTLPIFSAMKQSYPDYDIEVLCHQRNVQVLEKYPFVDRIWCWNINAKLFRNRYDQKKRQELYDRPFSEVIFIAEKCNFRTLFRLQQFNTHRLLSLPYYSAGKNNKLVTKEVYDSLFDGLVGKSKDVIPHFALRMFSSISYFCLNDSENIDFYPYLPDCNVKYKGDKSACSVLFNPAGTQPGNTLSHDKSIWVVNTLTRLKCNVFVFDLPKQRDLLEGGGIESKVTFIQSSHIGEGAKVLQQMDFVVTTDTAIGHLSSAFKKPTLILREDQLWRAMCDPLVNTTKVLVSEVAEDINTVPNAEITAFIEQLLLDLNENHDVKSKLV
ncbi:glycosyltransferase family 9 protein [Shewanella surugensis]|uniref:Lipopolysaccharide heptosyltransferase family protein n=1 Tax=Shewanella surugensis TaxID=212020 RepID=A0ABT0LBG5_9GAMM|nr:glycosyltransferase family 9 protein [Shewanella surugensis]MCL1124692.1 hypothetical protein [Shewanella surugensis]